jgi:hypothetical protein
MNLMNIVKFSIFIKFTSEQNHYYPIEEKRCTDRAKRQNSRALGVASVPSFPREPGTRHIGRVPLPSMHTSGVPPMKGLSA